jgi:hypothetical protein
MVGILIILIVVIGVRAGDAWTRAARESKQTGSSTPLADVQTHKAQVATLALAVDEVGRQIASVDEQIGQQTQRRNELEELTSEKGKKIDQIRTRLDSDKRAQVQLSRSMAAARLQLDDLYRRQREADQLAAEPVVIAHYPTPLAKTVFGEEEHFRLLGGRLVHVPLDELVEQLQREARLKIWKLTNAPSITETIGPTEGFRLKYVLQRRRFATGTPSGPVVGSVVELDRFVLIPVSEGLGEPLETALTSDSAFLKRLGQLDASTTTITVWTYPDSYPEFRKLREFLQQRGFLTAARPMPHGHPIGGSPRGSKSAAQ